MRFLHVNEYYINMDYIAFIKESSNEYTIHFGTTEGQAYATSVERGAEQDRLMTRLVNMPDVGIWNV